MSSRVRGLKHFHDPAFFEQQTWAHEGRRNVTCRQKALSRRRPESGRQRRNIWQRAGYIEVRDDEVLDQALSTVACLLWPLPSLTTAALKKVTSILGKQPILLFFQLRDGNTRAHLSGHRESLRTCRFAWAKGGGLRVNGGEDRLAGDVEIGGKEANVTRKGVLRANGPLGPFT